MSRLERIEAIQMESREGFKKLNGNVDRQFRFIASRLPAMQGRGHGLTGEEMHDQVIGLENSHPISHTEAGFEQL